MDNNDSCPELAWKIHHTKIFHKYSISWEISSKEAMQSEQCSVKINSWSNYEAFQFHILGLNSVYEMSLLQTASEEDMF